MNTAIVDEVNTNSDDDKCPFDILILGLFVSDDQKFKKKFQWRRKNYDAISSSTPNMIKGNS